MRWRRRKTVLYEFTSDGSFEIAGRGRVCTITSGYPEELWDPNQLQGLTVRINGDEFVCRGIETYCVHRDENHPYPQRLAFGILI